MALTPVVASAPAPSVRVAHAPGARQRPAVPGIGQLLNATGRAPETGQRQVVESAHACVQGSDDESPPPTRYHAVWQTMRRWGLACVKTVDLGAIECAAKPVRFDELSQECRGPSGTTSFGCHDIVSEHTNWCTAPSDELLLPGAKWEEPQLIAPCMICALRPSSVVEVPCGHINVCGECHRDYQTNQRCLRCRQDVPVRVDLTPFLDAFIGAPDLCRMCRQNYASVVVLPCVHMSFCHTCLPKSLAGCPSCGAPVERMVTVLWAACGSSDSTPNMPGLLASVGALASHRGGREGLIRTTAEVDAEIASLEQQLSQLKQKSATNRPVHQVVGDAHHVEPSPQVNASSM